MTACREARQRFLAGFQRLLCVPTGLSGDPCANKVIPPCPAILLLLHCELPPLLLQIYFYFYSLLRAAVVSSNRRRRGLPGVSAGSIAARTEDIGVPASLLVAAVAGAVNMVLTSPAQVRSRGVLLLVG